MARSCPECGGAVEYQSRSVELLEGSCAACGKAVVVLPPAAGASAADRAAASTASPAQPCWECGGALTLTVLPGPAIEARCDACDTTTRLAAGSAPGGSFEPAVDEGEEEDEDEEEESGGDEPRPGRDGPRGPRGRPPRGPERPRFGGGREAPYRPAARPCRQCGGPLDFDSNQDGSITGRCRSCGNTFTMRPRGPPGPPRGFARRPGWGGRPSGPRFSSGPRRPWRGDRDEDDDRPRRRRRRDE